MEIIDQKCKNGKIGPFSIYISPTCRRFPFLDECSGRTHRLTVKEIAKCFVSGLKPDIFREEMYSRSFDTLEDVIREAREDLSTYRDIMEISDRIKKVEPEREFSKPSKDFPTAVSNLKRGAIILSPRGFLEVSKIGKFKFKDRRPQGCGIL